MAKFHHWTSQLHLKWIATEGISRGEVPVNLTTVLDYPNLTTDPAPGNQGWSRNDMTDKVAVRITVEIPDGDPALISWRVLAEQHKCPRVFYRALDMTGGYGARHWWIYRGVIPPDWFTSVEIIGKPKPVEAALLAVADHYATFDQMMIGEGFTRSGGTPWMIDGAGLRAILTRARIPVVNDWE